MMKESDHTSVGMLVWLEGKLLLIERAKPPWGFAPPAGHVDGDPSYEDAARRELQEEVGLTATTLRLVGEGRKENQCRRQGGSWHQWKIFATTAEGTASGSIVETKQDRWCTPDELHGLAERTRAYQTGKISEERWRRSRG